MDIIKRSTRLVEQKEHHTNELHVWKTEIYIDARLTFSKECTQVLLWFNLNREVCLRTAGKISPTSGYRHDITARIGYSISFSNK